MNTADDRPPPVGPSVLGGHAVGRFADHRLHVGHLLPVAPGVVLGVAKIYPDGSATVKFFGGGHATGPPFWERYVDLRPGERVTHAGHAVQLVESMPTARPKPWIRLICA